MSLTAEEIARREWEAMSDPDQVKVKVRVSERYGLLLPDDNGEREEEAVFKILTFGDNHVLEKATRYTVESEETRGRTNAYDPNEFRRLLLKKNLLFWTLSVPIEREEGWMTPECYERIGTIPAPLLEAFLDGFEHQTAITEEEERILHRQASILFSESSRGVSDACEAVSLFCTLGNYWEKFGLDKDKLRDFPQKEYLLLKMMIGKESEAIKSKHKSSQPTTRIAGPGGRTRPSRGKRIPM